MKKLGVLLLIVFITNTSCNNKKGIKINRKTVEIIKNRNLVKRNIIEHKLSNSEIERIVLKIETQLKNEKLIKYSFPEMSLCGGDLNGYYKTNNLKFIDAVFRAELGFSSKKVYWNKSKIIKLIYQEHFAEWEKYEKNYPPEKFEYDPKKMTYTDTIYKITFGVQYKFIKLSKGKIISTKINNELIERLSECVYQMREELKIEKIKEKSS